jgi:hypothetical protein
MEGGSTSSRAEHSEQSSISAAEPAATSKTVASQQSKGAQSYYYWHNAVPQGENAAPRPTPQQLGTSQAAVEQPPISIDSYAFQDDDDVVKVFISLEGALAGLTANCVAADFKERSLRVALQPPGGARAHLLSVSELSNPVRPEHCGFKITKAGKLVIKLDKSNAHHRWSKLRR